jgi:hypothetical protein
VDKRDVRGATDILGGINEGLGSQILPLGSAPAAVAKGIAGSVAGSVAAPYAVRKMGGSPDAQALAGEVGAALPLAGSVGADLPTCPVKERHVDPMAGAVVAAHQRQYRRTQGEDVHRPKLPRRHRPGR